MLGQSVSLLNNLMAGRVTGAPWWRNVRKGLLFRIDDTDSKMSQSTAYNSINEMYPSKGLKSGTVWAAKDLSNVSYLFKPAKAFSDRYKALTRGLDDKISNYMFFMYNPTTWSRTTTSGLQAITIPGGSPVYHQASIVPQTFELSLLLDNTVWFNADTFAEAMKDSAIGALSALPRAIGDGSEVNDAGLRELQFYHSATEGSDDPLYAPEASLAPIINWYERLATPSPETLVQPTVLVAYQDMFVRCIVNSVKTDIMRSDWRQNIQRATVTLSFTVLYNPNFNSPMKKYSDIQTMTRRQNG